MQPEPLDLAAYPGDVMGCCVVCAASLLPNAEASKNGVALEGEQVRETLSFCTASIRAKQKARSKGWSLGTEA